MRFPPLWAAPPPGARAGGWALHGSTRGRAHHVKLLLQARARLASRVPPPRAQRALLLRARARERDGATTADSGDSCKPPWDIVARCAR